MRPVGTLTLALVLLAGPLLAGCIGGDDGLSPNAGEDLNDTAGAPGQEIGDWPRQLPQEIHGLEAVAQVEYVESGGGLMLEGDLAYVSGQNSGFYILDVSTPGSPELVSRIPDQFSRDVDLLHYPNRTVAVLAASGQGMVFVDVTDPAKAEVIGQISQGIGNAHNIAVVPGTHLVYNSRSVDTPGVDIVDATDPADPQAVATFGDLTCHDVTFHMAEDQAFCPGVRETQIWDISDPEAPSVISRIVNPAINIHHWAIPAHNGSLLIIGDEFAGSTDAAAGCLADGMVANRWVSDPVGAVWFYDISDESLPTPISWYAPDLPADNVPPTPCTAHFGELVPERDLLVIGWRAAGTYLVDFSDLSQPVPVDHITPAGDTWEARYHNGYIFTGDTDRGMDVLTFTGERG